MTVSCNPVGYFADYTIAIHQKNPTNVEGVRQFAKGNLKGGGRGYYPKMASVLKVVEQYASQMFISRLYISHIPKYHCCTPNTYQSNK